MPTGPLHMQIVEACLLHPSKGCTVAIPDRRDVNACRDEGIAVWRAAGDTLASPATVP